MCVHREGGSSEQHTTSLVRNPGGCAGTRAFVEPPESNLFGQRNQPLCEGRNLLSRVLTLVVSCAPSAAYHYPRNNLKSAESEYQ